MDGPVQTIRFSLNGKEVELNDPSSQASLNDWIRSQHGLTGTKKMCDEGGCGCCVVSLTKTDLLTKKQVTLAVNSCLCPLYSINRCSITTVEGIGSSRKGFHPLQKKIAELNGTQCGYCTPGMVMNMYSLLQENPKPTKQLVEDSFDGNICRCTGYRSILDAMKSFAVDSNETQITDIEDINSIKCSSCPARKGSNNWCTQSRTTADPIWYQPTKLSKYLIFIKPTSVPALNLLVEILEKEFLKNQHSLISILNLTWYKTCTLLMYKILISVLVLVLQSML